MNSVLKYSDIDKDKINYNKPEKVGTSYFGSISYNETLKPLYIQSPKLKCNIDKENRTYIDVEIDEDNYSFYEYFISLDDQNIRKTYQNSIEWFNKELPLEAIDDMYKRTTKPIKRNNKPTIRFKIPVVKNQIQCSIYNQDRIYMDFDNIPDESNVILILHLR